MAQLVPLPGYEIANGAVTLSPGYIYKQVVSAGHGTAPGGGGASERRARPPARALAPPDAAPDFIPVGLIPLYCTTHVFNGGHVANGFALDAIALSASGVEVTDGAGGTVFAVRPPEEQAATKSAATTKQMEVSSVMPRRIALLFLNQAMKAIIPALSKKGPETTVRAGREWTSSPSSE